MLSKLERCDCTTQKDLYGASGNSLMASKSYLVIMCHLHAPSTTTNSVYTFPNLLESFYSYPSLSEWVGGTKY